MLVSVITPARIVDQDGVKQLYAAIDSVRRQSCGEVEMVIVNDSSPFRSPEMAELEHGYSIAKMHNGINRGVAQARNQAVSLARGQLILPLDHDDMLDEDAIKVMVNVLDQNSRNVFVYPGVMEFGAGAAVIRRPSEYTRETLLDKNPFPVGCLISKLDILKAGGWKDGLDGLEDWEFWLRCISSGICGIGVDAPLYWYRQRGDSLSRTIQDKENKTNIIRSAYKEVGDRMCCPGKKPKGVSRQKTRSAPVSTAKAPAKETVVIGVDGMTELEYLLSGGARWWGGGNLPTKTKYKFGGIKKFGLVDDKDVSYLLSMREGGKQVFKRSSAAPTNVETTIYNHSGEVVISQPVTTDLLQKTATHALIDIPEVDSVKYSQGEVAEYIGNAPLVPDEPVQKAPPIKSHRGRPRKVKSA